MKRVRLLDSAWLVLEAPETPMHVGVVLRFSPPPDAAPDYILQVTAALRASTSALSPWDLILPAQRLRGLIPVWLHECYLDMEHHVRLHRLVDGEAELNRCVSDLHAQPLDRTRPLWECHVFSGLPQQQFVLYMKVHHALLDGVGGLRLMQKLLAHSPMERDQPPPWSSTSQPAKPRVNRAGRIRPTAPTPVNAEAVPLKNPGVMSHLMRAGRELTRAAISHADQLATPYRAPTSPLNARITASRAFGMETCELTRIKRLAQLAETSSNDVVLAVCAGALQRLLADLDAGSVPLTAAVPVSTRRRHGEDTGTALSICLANLGTDIREPRTRLKAIHASTQRAKEHLGRLPRAAQLPYTATFLLPFIAEQLSGYGGRLRPMFNVVISNVPGPRAPLYLEGARLETATPLSVLFHGQALNITCIRYTDRFSFGFTGCPDVLPGFDRLPGYTREALEELESEFSFPHRMSAGGRQNERSSSATPPPAADVTRAQA